MKIKKTTKARGGKLFSIRIIVLSLAGLGVLALAAAAASFSTTGYAGVLVNKFCRIVGVRSGTSTAGSRASLSGVTISFIADSGQTNTPVAGPITVTATAGTLGPTDYATLKAAFDAINAGTHQGAINISILGDTTETAPAVLNASGSGSASYTSILIAPNGARTVSGSIAAGSPLIDLNGASNVTINGLNSGGSSLTISNTTVSATASTSTIRFINGAQNDTVTNCSILGSSTTSLVLLTPGGTILFGATTGPGNNNNTISGNNIGPAGSNLPSKAISALGTSGAVNSGNIIDNNNIFDFYSVTSANSGIDIESNNNNWTISNNRIYQTAARTSTGEAGCAGITVNSSGNFFTIEGNRIGFGAADGTGTTTMTDFFRGLDLQSVSTETATSVQGNTISGINLTCDQFNGSSAFIGIALNRTNKDGLFDVGDVTGNTIGSLDGSSTIVINATGNRSGTLPVQGIFDATTRSTNISNNKIGAIAIQGSGTVTGFRGIYIQSGSPQLTKTINNNIVGGAVSGAAVTDSLVGVYDMEGITSQTAPVSINGNTVRNMSGNSNHSGLIFSGIHVSVDSGATNTSNISRNTVHSLSNAAGSAFSNVTGIQLSLPSNANTVERNLVHSL